MNVRSLTNRAATGLRRFDQVVRRRGELTVIALVAVLRLIILLRSSNTVHFLPTDGDMRFYSDWAMRIAGGQWTDHQAFYGLPLYAYFLAGFYKVFGFEPFALLLLQVAAEVLTGLFIYRLAPLVFGGRDTQQEVQETGPVQGSLPGHTIGLLAALGWAFFTPAQAYSTVLMPTSYFVATFWFVVWWILRERRTGLPRWYNFGLLGLLIGFVAMMTANILFLVGLVVAALILRQSWIVALPVDPLARWTTRAGVIALLLLGICVGTSPCWLHNYLVAGEPVMLSAHSGINFYIGNNPEANGYPKFPAGMHADQAGLLRDSITTAEKALGRPLRRYEVSAYWSAKAHQYIAEHPGEWLRLMGTKLANFWNNYRYDDLGIILPMQEDGVLLPGIGFGCVAALGLPGLLLAVWRRPRARWIAAAVLLHMASLLTVFVTERYRLAAVPGLLLLGSYGLVELASALASRTWMPALAYAGAAIAALFLVARPPGVTGIGDHDDYNTATVDIAGHHYDRAWPKLRRVCANNPNNAEAFFAMGNLALAEHRVPVAMQCYQRTLQLDPEHSRAMNNLGVIAVEAGQWQAACTLFSSALKINPDDAKLYYLLARARLNLHDVVGAREAIDGAIHLAPDRVAYKQLLEEIERVPAAAGS